MKHHEDLQLNYTDKESDNIKIWPCSLNWSTAEIDKNFNDYDSESKELILKYLTDPAYVSEGLNLIVN